MYAIFMVTFTINKNPKCWHQSTIHTDPMGMIIYYCFGGVLYIGHGKIRCKSFFLTYYLNSEGWYHCDCGTHCYPNCPLIDEHPITFWEHLALLASQIDMRCFKADTTHVFGVDLIPSESCVVHAPSISFHIYFRHNLLNIHPETQLDLKIQEAPEKAVIHKAGDMEPLQGGGPLVAS